MLEEKALTKEEAIKIESIFFEDDESIRLRDGKTYKIPPANLKNARRLMQLLKTVNIDAIILNFSPNDEDEQKENDLYEVLQIAFSAYPEIDREYLENYVDIVTASEIIEILIGLNGLKKSKPQQVAE